MVLKQMPNEAQLRVNVDEKLKDALDAVLARQGTSQKVGLTRLFEWFVALPPEMQALILGQVPGQGSEVLAKAVLERFTKEKGRGATSTGKKIEVHDR